MEKLVEEARKSVENNKCLRNKSPANNVKMSNLNNDHQSGASKQVDKEKSPAVNNYSKKGNCKNNTYVLLGKLFCSVTFLNLVFYKSIGQKSINLSKRYPKKQKIGLFQKSKIWACSSQSKLRNSRRNRIGKSCLLY